MGQYNLEGHFHVAYESNKMWSFVGSHIQLCIAQEEKQGINNNESNTFLYDLGQEEYDLALVVNNAKSLWVWWPKNGPIGDKCSLHSTNDATSWEFLTHNFWSSLVMCKGLYMGLRAFRFLQCKTNVTYLFDGKVRRP